MTNKKRKENINETSNDSFEKNIFQKNKLIVFEDKNIRRTFFNNEWWYVVLDIIQVLTDSKDPKSYLKDMKRRKDGFLEGWGQFATPLTIDTIGGKQKLNCVSIKGAFFLIQFIPSLKVIPFKQWLAQLGQDRIDEIENPELAQDRVKEYYQMKGYPKDWIDKRLRGITIRQELTDEWKNRGIENKKDYAILTNEIHKATFGTSIKEHKKLKNLSFESKHNLRDHMDDLELIFSMLGEKVATEITQTKNSIGFNKCQESAIQGGEVAGNARKDAEKKIGNSILNKNNYLRNNINKLGEK